MADQLGIDDAAYHRAQDEIGSVHDDLVREQRSLEKTMRSLLTDTWTGEAARQFAEGWADWETGCDEVLGGLVTMDHTMTAVAAQLHESDTHGHDNVARVHGRLGALP